MHTYMNQKLTMYIMEIFNISQEKSSSKTAQRQFEISSFAIQAHDLVTPHKVTLM